MRVAIVEASDQSLIEAHDLIKLLLTAEVEKMNQASIDEWLRVVAELTERLKAGVVDVDFLAMFGAAVEEEMVRRGLKSNPVPAKSH